MGLSKVVACFVAVLLLVGSEVSATCLDDCFVSCIGMESTCILGCYIKCKWIQGAEVEALVAKLSPEAKAKLREIEEKHQNQEAAPKPPKKL